MPQLNIRGIPSDRICVISKPLVEEMALICGCDTDNFLIDCIQTVSVADGEHTETYPFIEVAWFERGAETRDFLAQAITRHVHSLGIPEVEIAFKVYSEDSYYLNGVRFDRL